LDIDSVGMGQMISPALYACFVIRLLNLFCVRIVNVDGIVTVTVSSSRYWQTNINNI